MRNAAHRGQSRQLADEQAFGDTTADADVRLDDVKAAPLQAGVGCRPRGQGFAAGEWQVELGPQLPIPQIFPLRQRLLQPIEIQLAQRWLRPLSATWKPSPR